MLTLHGVTIQNKIYESSASLVYRGIQVQDDRAIVIKVLKQDYPSPQELTRYRQEYAITRSLNLKGVIKAYSQQDYQRTLVILLEDFGGESLDHWMRQQPNFCPMPLSNFLRLAIDITDILGRIHAAGVIHKDINPGNIVLNLETGVVKIIDFGIATRFDRTTLSFKSPHGMEGTLAYLSPEQTGRMNRLLDYRTDFYSLGVTFYELLTGRLPFSTTDILELVHCHIAKQPVLPCELNTAIPKAVSDIVMKLMAKNAEDRYQSAWGIKADLEHCVAQLTETGQIGSIQLGLQDVTDQFCTPQKLYGREAEIAALLAAFDRVAGGEDAERGRKGNAENEEDVASENIPVSPRPRIPAFSAMMLVSGYSGVGKSALVQELYKPITAKRGYFTSGKFEQFQRNIPHSAVVDALRKLVQQLLGEPDAQVQQWRSRLLTALGSNAQLIVDVIPEVELIIGKQQPVPEVGATEAQNRFNRVFQQFIRVFCSKEHPLVIFLDDLQWIDSAALKVIELMLLDEQTQHLFLIGAYRDNEVSSTHPLALTLEELRKQGVRLQQIVLAPLMLEPLKQLIAETLHQDADAVGSLAQLVLHKTEGNPFFVGEFLRSLHSENLLYFNTEQRRWQWNIAQIEAQDITDNVVDLLLRKLKKLPEVTQQLLQLAACIGCEFDLETLAIVCQQSPKKVFQNLLTTVQSGFIQPLSDLDENLLVQNYKFLHDRVQQAAYALIDESHQQIVHLQIGRNLLENIVPEQLSERLFEIVDHLNLGVDLVVSQQERNSIARLNLMAAQKAKAATAYRAALKYAIAGIELLATNRWQHQYDLSLVLHEEAAEAAYLSGDFLATEHWAAIVLQEARTVLDEVRVHEVIIKTLVAHTRKLDAIKVGLQILAKLGLNLPEPPAEFQIQQVLLETEEVLRGRNIQDLVHLPLMTDANRLAAMRIISNIISPAFQAAPALFWLMACEQVKLSIQYGNAPASAVAYSCYGVVITAVTQDVEKAHQLGQLALNLVERLNAKELKSKTFLNVAEGISFGKSHFREVASLLQESYSSGVETGDFVFAGLAAYQRCEYLYFSGLELTELEREMENCSHAIAQLKQGSCLNYHQIFWQAVLNLQGHANAPCCLQGAVYNEQQGLNRYLATNDSLGFQYLYINKLILCYLFGQFTQALKSADAAEGYLKGAPGQVTMPLLRFYDSLVRLAIYSSVPDSEQKELLLNVISNQEKLHKWASHAPMNFLHKYHLVEAEKARVLGQLLEAEKFYEQAIQGARENEYIQEEALAYELAAKHYLARGLEKFAQLYMKEAHYCYERWGAIAKVKDLEIRYPQFFPQASGVVDTLIHTTAGTTSNTSPVAFDFVTVMKASQAIAREIELEQLLRSLMQILIENAGAQTGCLILENAGEWFIEAACELNNGEQVCTTRVLQSIPIVNRLPESIIQYVIRTHESVILNDAIREGNFINDPYIQQNQTQSLLCLPLLNQSKLVGVLYLENQLATGVFTADRFSGDATRTQILNLLSTQAAIAIENAKLYSKLREGESRMKQFLEAVPVGIGVLDAAGRPYYANQRAIQLLGKGIDSSMTADQLAEAYQVYLAGTKQHYPTEGLPSIRALRGERAKTDDLEIHQNDKIIPVESWGTPVFDEQGNVAYAIAAFQDITERKQAEKLLADYNRTLEQQVAERTVALQQSEAALRDVYDELRLREQELRLITDALPVCISYVDANQRYRFINRTYEEWFSRSREQILEKHVCEILGEKAYQVVESYINQVFEGQAVTLEVEMPLPSGKKYIKSTLIPDFDGNAQVKGFYSLNTDISDYKRAEAALQASEAELRALFAAVPDPLFVLTAEGRVIEAVEVGTGQLYKPIEEQVGKTLHEILSPEQADEFLGYIHQVVNTQQVLTVEYSLSIAGQTTWFSARIAPIQSDQVLWLARDITDRKRAEEASILEERNRMAREIHDTLAQAFTGILVHMGAVSRIVATNPEAIQTHINTVRDLARSGLAEARRSVAALRPQVLEEGSLGTALEQFVSCMQSSTETRLICEIIGTPYALPPETENNLLRIAQEAFTNAIKYANASEIRIELVYRSMSCFLRIVDNGQGFEVNTATLNRGFGLLGITERTEHIGAQLSIESYLGQGTEVVVTVNRDVAI